MAARFERPGGGQEYGWRELDILAQHDELRVGHCDPLVVLVVAEAVSWDLFFMWLRRVRTGNVVDINRINMQRLLAEVRAGWGGDDHSLPVPGLGLTMADGGEKIDSSEKNSGKQSPRK